MTTTSKRAGASLLEVRLSDGSRWRGTQAQLRRAHPDWLPYAQWVAAPYAGHSASIHPEDAPAYTIDDQAENEEAEEDDDLSGYPDERPHVAPPSAVRTMQRYRGYSATHVDVHEGPRPWCAGPRAASPPRSDQPPMTARSTGCPRQEAGALRARYLSRLPRRNGTGGCIPCSLWVSGCW